MKKNLDISIKKEFETKEYENNIIYKNEDDIFTKKRKINKKSLLITIFFSFLIIFSSLSVYWWQKNKSETLKNNQQLNKEQEKSGDDIWYVQETKNQIGSSEDYIKKDLLMASKENNNIVIYLKKFGIDSEEKIFEFIDKQKTYRNKYNKNFLQNIAYSPAKKVIAYSDDEKLGLYDLDTKENRSLIKLEKKPAINLSISPEWSIKDLGDTYEITNLNSSHDGNFLSFIEIHSNSKNLGIIDIKNNSYLPVKKVDGERVIGLSAKWAKNANIIICPEFDGENNSGLFVSNHENINALEDLSEKINKKYMDFYEAEISSDNKKIVFIYKDNYDDENNNILAISDLNGENFKILDKKDFKTLPFFSFNNKSILFTNDLSDNTLLLSSVDIETKNKKDLLVFPKDFNFWSNPNWINENYLSIIGDSINPEDIQENKTLHLIIDIEKNKNIHNVKFDKKYGFVGFLNN